MNREQIVEKMKTRLDHWNADIDALERKAEAAQQSGKQEIQATVAALKEKREQVKQQLQSVRAAGDDAFEDLHQGFEQGWDEISTAFRQARQRFN